MPPYYSTGSQNVWLNWADCTTQTSPWNAWVGNITYAASNAPTAWTVWTTGGTGWDEWSDEVWQQHFAEQQRRIEAERQRVAEAQAARARADETARALLVRHLNRRQRSELAREGAFTVFTRGGRRAYRIRPGGAPVRIKGEDGRCWSYCIHPHEWVPPSDVALAQKLLLEADEQRFLQIANASAA